MESQVSYVMFKAGISLFLKKKVAYVSVKSNAVRNILLGTWVLVSVQLTRREFRLCMPLERWSLDITLFVWLWLVAGADLLLEKSTTG